MKTRAEAEALAGFVALHAFDSHAAEFGMIEVRAFEALVQDVVMSPSAERSLRNGRTAYWSEQHAMVVIENRNAPAQSTAFRPTGGSAYFLNLQ